MIKFIVAALSLPAPLTRYAAGDNSSIEVSFIARPDRRRESRLLIARCVSTNNLYVLCYRVDVHDSVVE